MGGPELLSPGFNVYDLTIFTHRLMGAPGVPALMVPCVFFNAVPVKF